jgi:hypothetical protein
MVISGSDDLLDLSPAGFRSTLFSIGTIVLVIDTSSSGV